MARNDTSAYGGEAVSIAAWQQAISANSNAAMAWLWRIIAHGGVSISGGIK